MSNLKPKARISKQCPICLTINTLHLDVECYDNWKAGMLIQHAFPDLTPDQREILITGICCWDENVAIIDE